MDLVNGFCPTRYVLYSFQPSIKSGHIKLKKHQQHIPLRSTRQITVLQDVRGSKKEVLSFHQAALASDKQQER